MELCQVSQEVAAYAFHKYKGMEKASEMLLEPAIRKKIEKEAKVLRRMRNTISFRDSYSVGRVANFGSH